MKQGSFIRRTIIMLVLQMGLLFAILFIFLYSSYRTTEDNINQMLDDFLQIYGNELENRIENSDRILERLIYKNTEYEMLQSDSESDRYYASVKLKTMLAEAILNDSDVGMIVIAENNYQTCLDNENQSVSARERTDIRKFALENAKETNKKALWGVKMMDGSAFVYKMYVWQGKSAGIFIPMDRFMKTAGNSKLQGMTMVLTDTRNVVYGIYGEQNTLFHQGYPLLNEDMSRYREKGFEISNGSMHVYAFLQKTNFIEQIKSSMLVFFSVILMSLLSTFFLVWYIRRDILKPMKYMTGRMKNIQNGDYELRITENYRNREFSTLKTTFNNLMDEIMGLKIERYEKQIELQESELRTIRLQIRPHFFLNAMTTISSLSMQQKFNEIKIYIEALSKNIRYMFRSGLHTVSLAEEIRHVENYFEMQELKYPGCVFYFIDVEQELGEWRIPQMLIHTIIENEYKYAVSVDEMLTILIRVTKVIREGEELLSISIEDDGKGYPLEVLELFSEDKTEMETDGSRVGLWSIRKSLRLMYERDHLFEISNIEPHGCMNQFWIPRKPVMELRSEPQNKID